MSVEIDYKFLEDLRGKNDIPEIVEEPEKVKAFKERLAKLTPEKKAVVKTVPKNFILQKSNNNNLFNKNFMKEKVKYKKSLPSVKSTPQCPPGYIRSVKTGKCIKQKKEKVKVESSIALLLRDIRV